MRLTLRFTVLISFLLFASLQVFSQLAFPANDPNISTMGRTHENASGDIEFDWPGVTIETIFTGTSCTIKMDDTKENFYNVFIDEMPVKVVSVSGNTELRLANNLAAGDHTIKITKRTEGNQGLATFKGFILDNGAALKKPDADYKHKIEFIGNSITCGYGSEGKNKEEKFMPETENNYKSYAPITARAFNSEYHIVAHSGQGVVRNYGDENMISEYACPTGTSKYLTQKKNLCGILQAGHRR